MPGPAPSRAALQALDRSFHQAWDQYPSQRHRTSLVLGGFTVELSVAGDALWERVSPAFSHLEGPGSGGSPDLSIRLWDENATGIAAPFTSLPEVLPSGKPFGFGLLGEDPFEGIAGYQTTASCVLLDPQAGRLSGWVHDPQALSDYETGKPLQPLLFAWAQEQDLLPVHAALIAHRGRGILLGGPGGSGKSTAALTCLNAGFHYLGDDYIGVPPREGAHFRGHSFYSTSWLEPGHALRFPWLAEALEDGVPLRGEKRLIRLDAIYRERLTSSVPVHALAVLRVGRGAAVTEVRKIRPAEAVLRLAPSSILQLPFSDPERLLDRMTGVAHAVPCYHVELGTDLASIPRCLERILDEPETP